MFPLSHFVEKYGPMEDLGEGLTRRIALTVPIVSIRKKSQLFRLIMGGYVFCCLNLHDHVGRCGWCDEFVAGRLEDSYVAGAVSSAKATSGITQMIEGLAMSNIANSS
jgi:hypothetical protein